MPPNQSLYADVKKRRILISTIVVALLALGTVMAIVRYWETRETRIQKEKQRELWDEAANYSAEAIITVFAEWNVKELLARTVPGNTGIRSRIDEFARKHNNTIYGVFVEMVSADTELRYRNYRNGRRHPVAVTKARCAFEKSVVDITVEIVKPNEEWFIRGIEIAGDAKPRPDTTEV